MISVVARQTLRGTKNLGQVTGVTIPDWAEVSDLRLLKYVDHYSDTVFNDLQLSDLNADLSTWLAYETERGDPHNRRDTIVAIRALTEAQRYDYLFFLGE